MNTSIPRIAGAAALVVLGIWAGAWVYSTRGAAPKSHGMPVPAGVPAPRIPVIWRARTPSLRVWARMADICRPPAGHQDPGSAAPVLPRGPRRQGHVHRVLRRQILIIQLLGHLVRPLPQ